MDGLLVDRSAAMDSVGEPSRRRTPGKDGRWRIRNTTGCSRRKVRHLVEVESADDGRFFLLTQSQRHDACRTVQPGEGASSVAPSLQSPILMPHEGQRSCTCT